MAKRVKRKPGDPSPAQKAAATRKRNKLQAEEYARQAQPAKAEKPDIEKSNVEVTPYPRAVDNKKFEGALDNIGSAAARPVETEPAKPAAPTPAIAVELLTAADVAEWVAWPFLLWSQNNDMPSLQLSAKEATSVAEPLTTILNRHGAAKHLPPDAIDALKIGARVTPIMSDRFAAIKSEREKRAAAGEGDKHSPAPFATATVQGAQATKPKEV